MSAPSPRNHEVTTRQPLLTPEGTLFEGTARAVFLPGAVSPFEVLPGHGAIISALGAGPVRVVSAARSRSMTAAPSKPRSSGSRSGITTWS